MSEKKFGKELNKSPSVATVLAPPTPGEHVFRVQLKSCNGKYLTVDSINLLLAKSESTGPETIFEFHRLRCQTETDLASLQQQTHASPQTADANASIPSTTPATPSSAASTPSSTFLTSSTPPSASQSITRYRYAIRSPLGRFLNIDDSIELFLKDKSSKDLGPRCDRSLDALTAREKSFTIVESTTPGMSGIAIRGPDQFGLANDGVDAKIKIVRYGPSDSSAFPLSPSASASAKPAVVASVGVGVAFSPTELFQPIWLDDRSPLTLSGPHTIRTSHNLLWCVEPDGTLVANRREPILWEPIQIRSASLTHVRFQSVHGQYLQYEDNDASKRASFAPAPIQPTLDGSTSPIASIDSIPKFEVIPIESAKNSYAFKAPNGCYLCAQGTHIITVTSKSIGPWEIFQLETAEQI